MRLIRHLFGFFWIPFCAMAMLGQTRVLIGMPPAPDWIDGFVFGATVFGYHFNHTHGSFRLGIILAGFFGGICFLMATKQRADTIEWLITCTVPLLLWLAYYGLTRTGKTGLRAQPVAKPLVIAFTWAWVSVFLPTNTGQWSELILMFLGRAAFLFVLALCYDLVDTEYDLRHGLNTLVGKLGYDRSFCLIYTGLVFASLCAAANFWLGILNLPAVLALIFSLVFSAWWLYFLMQKTAWAAWQKVLIDGLMVLQCALVVLSQAR